MATGITESDVWAAADALLLEGARPTIERVRQKIGRGSPNTVSPHLETWFRSLGARIKDPRAFAAPPEVPDPIAQAAAHFWEAALTAARAEQAQAYQQRWEELAKEGERFAAQAEQLQQREAQLLNRERDLQEGLKVATAQLAATEERLQAAEAQLRQRDKALAAAQENLADAQGAIQTLLAEADQARDRHAQALAALDSRHAAHERRWLNELDGERGAVKRLQTRLDELQATSQQQADQLRQALATAREQQRAAELDAQALRAQGLADTRQRDAEAAAIQETLQASRRGEADLARRLAAEQARADDLYAQIKSKDKQFSDLARRLLPGAGTPDS
ncbi:DNA-binding protein [Achromobacter deleyi]|uniref:DNA-binding protein n=1 Tax=Achromobacter deleyi TaxID=1353891 RepID=UPI001491E57C|nr:DNA-binding protein [Achromobacter deleyi]QVQ28186.1 DNA-binding protein [Achromobacter deleyi]UIP18375.1 DNA-binding protein [Achromobacter deleyi]